MNDFKDVLMEPVKRSQEQAWAARRLNKLRDQLDALIGTSSEYEVIVVHDSIIIKPKEKSDDSSG